MKVKDLEKLEDTIYKILVENKKAREDDMFLYYLYCKNKWLSINKSSCEFVFMYEFFRKIFIDEYIRRNYKIASFTSVERARRKVQEKHPELKSNVEARAEEEKVYREYAKN